MCIDDMRIIINDGYGMGMCRTPPSLLADGMVAPAVREVPTLMAKTGFRSVDEYIAVQSEPVQRVLKRVRRAIRKAAPAAEELISCGTVPSTPARSGSS
jgi:hypothetical protein